MNVQQSYDSWSSQYDTNKNKTRDLEALSLRTTLLNIPFDSCLEIGCGTGKNTEWLVTRAGHITAVDLSEGMLAIARNKVASDKVQFRQADITQPWAFADRKYKRSKRALPMAKFVGQYQLGLNIRCNMDKSYDVSIWFKLLSLRINLWCKYQLFEFGLCNAKTY